MSQKRAATLGWRRVDSRSGGKLGALWRHVGGWFLAHCGHPTALWPWALVAPDGSVHCSGARSHGEPTHGVAWPTLTQAMEYVELVRRGSIPLRVGRRDMDPRPWLAREVRT